MILLTCFCSMKSLFSSCSHITLTRSTCLSAEFILSASKAIKIYTIKYHVIMFVILYHPIMHQSQLPSMQWSCPHHFLPLQNQLNLLHVQSFVFHQPLRQFGHLFFVSGQYFLCPVVRLLQWYKQHYKTTITPCVILVNQFYSSTAISLSAI